MSDDTQYSIVFSGELAAGVSADQVKQKAAQLFKMDERKIESIFQASSVVLKKGLALSSAQKYQRAISTIGMLVNIQESTPPAQASAPSLQTTASDSTKTSTPAAVEFSISNWEVKPVGERLTDSVDVSVGEGGGKVESSVKPRLPDFSLAPRASEILSSTEKKSHSSSPALLNVDGITIRAVGEPLLDPQERSEREQSVVVNVSHINMQAVGDDLLRPEERRVIDVSFPDISGMTLKENQ